ncbi:MULTISPECIES: chemotaxis protein CheA [Colwellia]|uniref:Chemotaxis protein CheA n=1 Tax=Colwellia marinimaniae TaxID=1513592 RepID=A0ABQ0MSF5_9GAMM|nr:MULTISPECIES: chemotaxis protein CheA [Colwellia]GAW95292.1 chemotaxis protein CheA [Colwellia marinimaniae]
MTVDLSQFIPSFLEESFEGLELMESELLNLKEGDNETIHSIFRAAHSIKGGAGTFGFDKVTEFTHLVETLLDEMRDGRREITSKDTEILLESVDCMRLLIEAARDDDNYDHDKVEQTTSRLAETLGDEPSSDSDNQSENIVAASNVCGYTINFIPEHSLAKTGNDPLFIFNALAELGQLTLSADCNDLPALVDIDPQELYLSWQLTLYTDVGEAEIREIFEWVEDECLLELVPIADTSNTSQDIEVLAPEEEPQSQSTTTNQEQLASTQNASSAIAGAKESTAEDTNIPATAKDKDKAKAKADVGSIRVGVDKIDNLINLVGELVITQSMLSELGNDFDMDKVDRLTSGLEQLLQNTKELQESVMRIRMLPISFAFNRFPRLVHDLAIKTGKKMELVIKGEQTELDKTVMEQIGDPLVHLVRNAADHGIESCEVRLAKGKPEKGTISLDAYHQGGNIVIEVKDDGAGIDRQVVLDKAVEKGLIEADAILTESQVYDLLFEPGFSTAAEVTDISGRGVGMDVVKRNIQSLGGRIQVESTLGKGSCFRVHLPLTLAILDGQLVKVGSETYIIPLIAIVESLQIDNKLINRVSGDMVLYRLRDDNVPILPIYQLFNLATKCTEIDKALLVVVEADGQKIGLMVDDLLAQQQVVIKSLKDNYQQVAGISGATILGDGSVAMILDIPGIIHMALAQAQHAQREKTDGNASVTAEVCL